VRITPWTNQRKKHDGKPFMSLPTQHISLNGQRWIFFHISQIYYLFFSNFFKMAETSKMAFGQKFSWKSLFFSWLLYVTGLIFGLIGWILLLINLNLFLGVLVYPYLKLPYKNLAQNYLFLISSGQSKKIWWLWV
jgi:hypothetical protein